ncbi:MAG TPA: right-handed parallel beta-helix repeat-containing protein, partial [bacterium]|nr:right-handed parallel beta-helix repeat-containing protein [bacterium]
AFDSHITNGQTYYNESWFSTAKICSAPYNGPIWYVNPATGSDTLNEGSGNLPYRTINKAMSAVSQNDTIMLVAGTYSETIVFTQSNIALVGADSTTTIIDPVGDSTATTLYGIFAQDKNKLRISGLRITNCYYGIYFNNVDTSIIDNVTADWCGKTGGQGSGVYLYNGSCSNAIQNCNATTNFYGFLLDSNSNNAIVNNIARSNASHGFYLKSNLNNSLVNNLAISNSSQGFMLESETNAALTNNSANSNNNGFYINSGSGNIFSNNYATSNQYNGFTLNTSSNNTFINNFFTSNTRGVNMFTSSNNKFSNNIFNSNSVSGIQMESSSNNLFAQNDIKSNSQYQIYFETDSQADTFTANNIQTSSTNIDSGVYNVSVNNLSFSNNYWAVSDSSVISGRIKGTQSSKIFWQPYSLNEFDTAINADTIAPGAVTITSSDTSTSGRITINWTASSYGSGAAGGDGLAGYNIFRAKETQLLNGDTSNWYMYKFATVDHTATSWTDTDILISDTYYYRVTAFDRHTNNGQTYSNESWYSDKVKVIPLRISAVYVDAANGNDANTGSDTEHPKKTIGAALTAANSGDTIFIKAGIYNEALTITKNDLKIIGEDSATVIIDPTGDSINFNNVAVKFTNVSGIRINNFTVKDACYGIYLDGCDSSVFENISITNCNGNVQSVGFYFYRNSDSVTIRNSYFANNSRSIQSYSSAGMQYNNHFLNNIVLNSLNGILLYNASGVQIKNNSFNSGTGSAISLNSGFTNGIVSDNRIDFYNFGLSVSSGADSNYIFNNIINNIYVSGSGGYGMSISSDSNIIDSNTITSNSNSAYGAWLETNAETNIVRNNAFYGVSRVGSGSYDRGKNNFYYNNYYNNLNFGLLWASGGLYLRAESNRFNDNTKGLVFNDGDSSYVYNNIMSNNQYGIDFLSGSDFNRADSNSITNNQYGINISSSSYNRIDSNYIANSQYGIKAAFTISVLRDNIFNSNTIYSSSHSGIYLEYCLSSVLTNNVIDSWAMNGLYISATSGNPSYSDTITGNIIRNGGNSATRNSVYLQYLKQPLFENNTITGNNARGIYLINTDSAVIRNNTIENNLGEYAAYLGNSHNNSIFNNTFNNNGSLATHYGIYLTGSDNNNFSSNIINGNMGYGMYLNSGSDSNIFILNRILANNRTEYIAGFAGGISNKFELNTINTNAAAFTFTNAAFDTSNVLNNNNIYGTNSSLVNNTVDVAYDMRNNYWTTTDSGVLYNNRFTGAYKNKLLYQPYRFSEIDTSLNADTIAPSTPNITGFDTSVLGQITVKWDSPAYSGAGSEGLAGFHIFRASAAQLAN